MNIIKKNKQKNYLRNKDIYRVQKKSTLKDDVIISNVTNDVIDSHIYFALETSKGNLKCVYTDDSYLRNIKFMINEDNELMIFIAEYNTVSATLTNGNLNLIY